jgi:hypothetical protein
MYPYLSFLCFKGPYATNFGTNIYVAQPTLASPLGAIAGFYCNVEYDALSQTWQRTECYEEHYDMVLNNKKTERICPQYFSYDGEGFRAQKLKNFAKAAVAH